MIQVWQLLLIILIGPIIGWLVMFLYDKNQEFFDPYLIAIKSFFKRDRHDKKK